MDSPRRAQHSTGTSVSTMAQHSTGNPIPAMVEHVREPQGPRVHVRETQGPRVHVREAQNRTASACQGDTKPDRECMSGRHKTGP
eukprot:349707-Chlamydomonas_euryale.AAC.4